MTGTRLGLGGSFRQGLLAYLMRNTINKARRMPVVRVLSSKIGLTMISVRSSGTWDIFDESSRGR